MLAAPYSIRVSRPTDRRLPAPAVQPVDVRAAMIAVQAKAGGR